MVLEEMLETIQSVPYKNSVKTISYVPVDFFEKSCILVCNE
jgi:hypothetical protein